MALAVNEYFLIEPNWIEVISFKKKWNTSFQRSINNKTVKKSALFTWPRRALQFRVDAQSYTQAAFLKRKIYKNLPNVWGVPIWQDRSPLTASAASGQPVLACDTTNRNYEVGGECILYTSQDTYFVGTILSKTDSSITLTGNLTATWAEATSVFPILKSRIEKTQQIGYQTDSISQITFNATEEFDSVTRNVPSVSGYPTHKDIPVFITEPDWETEVEETQIHNYEMLKFLGATQSWDQWDATDFRYKALYKTSTKEEAGNIIDFFDYHKGRWGSFWRPSWLNDIKVTAAASAGAVTLEIEDIGFASYWEDEPAALWLMIYYPDGTYVFRAVKAVPDSTHIMLHRGLDDAITTADLSGMKVSFLSYCGFNQDELEVQFITDNKTDIELNFRNNSYDQPTFTTTTTSTTTSTSTSTSTSSSSSSSTTTNTQSTTSSTSSTTSSTTETFTTVSFTTTLTTTSTSTTTSTATTTTTVWLGTWANRRKITVDNTNIDSDLTHFPVGIRLGSVVGQSFQDVSDVFSTLTYPYTPTSVNDDFTGDDGDAPNTNLWHINLTPSGVTEISSNKLFMSVDPTTSDEYQVLESNYLLTGDFDITVNVSGFYSNGTDSGAGIEMVFRFDADEYFFIKMQTELGSTGWVARQRISGVSTNYYAARTNDFGAMRIKRASNVAYMYYDDGNTGSWTLLRQVTGITTNDGVFRLGCWNAATKDEVGGYFDNLSITGTASWYALWDYFDGIDGDAPNTDLWSLDNTSFCSLDTNKLKFNGVEDATPFANFILSGDFDIQIDFDSTSCPTTNSWIIGLQILQSSNGNGYLLGRSYNSGSKIDWMRKVNSLYAATVTYYSTSVNSGKVRLTRVGSVWTGYYDIGSGWVSLGTDDNGYSEDVIVNLKGDLWNTNPTITGYLDNFIINSGTVYWPENTYPARKKIAITQDDALTEIFGEIEHWDQENEKAVIWASKSDLILLTAANSYLYLYFDPAQDDNDYFIGDTTEENTVETITGDDFTGTDGDLPDSDLWVPSEDALTYSQILSNKLNHTSNDASNDISSLFTSVFKLSGDFDIQIDFDLTTFAATSTSSNYLQLWLFSSSQYWKISRIRGISTTGYARQATSDSWTGDYSTSELSGKLRFTRSGSTIKGYHWSGTQWEWASSTAGYTFTTTSSDDLFLNLWMKQEAGSSIDINIDNFIINSGTVVINPAAQVYDADFQAVYHMAQDPNGDPTDGILDSTINANHGTPSGSMTSADFVDGFMGKAIDFDGTDDLITITGQSFNFDILTLEGFAVNDYFGTSEKFLASNVQSGGYGIKRDDPSTVDNLGFTINTGSYHTIYADTPMAWNYYKDIVITGSTAGAQTDYAVKVTVTYESGKMNTDFSDIRFSDADSTEVYSYWRQTYTSSVSAIFWVKIPSIPASPGTTNLRMSYGNPAASTTTSGVDTFVFYDPLTDDAILDDSVWEVVQDQDAGAEVSLSIPATLFTAADGGQGLAADGTHFYVGKNNGSGVDGTIYKYLYAGGTAVTNFTGPEHCAGIDIREDNDTLLACSSGASPHELWEISKTGTKIREWTITDATYSYGSLVAYKSANTVYFLTCDSSYNFKIYELTLNDAGTYVEVDSWEATTLGTAQGLEVMDGRLFYFVDKSSSEHRIYELTLSAVDTSITSESVVDLDTEISSNEGEGLAYDGVDWFVGDSINQIWELATDGSAAMSCTTSTNIEAYMQTVTEYGPGYSILARAKGTGNYPVIIGLSDGTTGSPADPDNIIALIKAHAADGYLYGRQKDAGVQTEQAYSSTTNYTTYQRYEIQYNPDGTVKYLQNEVELSTSWVSSNVPNMDLKVVFGIGTYSSSVGGTVDVDYCGIRKFVDPEPSVGTPGTIGYGYHYLVGKYDQVNQDVFLEGVKQTTSRADTGAITDVAVDFCIGCNAPSGGNWQGIIDEIRLSDIARNDDWIKATNFTLKDDLLTFGDTETL